MSVKSPGYVAGTAGNQTYDTGTFTATATGFGSAVTGTAYYTRVGNMVTVYWPLLTGTSNAATFTVTGLPASLRPARAQGNVSGPLTIDNGGAITAGLVSLSTAGVLTVFKTPQATGSDWTASGTKTLGTFQQAYLLN